MLEQNQIFCNVCGVALSFDITDFGQEYVFIQKEWGYFSKKDGERHTIRLCEQCYDKWVSSFQIPIMKEDRTEFV